MHDAKVGGHPCPGRGVGRRPLLDRGHRLSRRYGDAACQWFVCLREHDHSCRREPTSAIALPKGDLHRASQGSIHPRMHPVRLPVIELPHGGRRWTLSLVLPQTCIRGTVTPLLAFLLRDPHQQSFCKQLLGKLRNEESLCEKTVTLLVCSHICHILLLNCMNMKHRWLSSMRCTIVYC